jgi:hypothetical protein
VTRDYLEAADQYRPAQIRTLFIAESPPAYSSEEKKSYFYFDQDTGSDILFGTLIEALYDEPYRKASKTKAALLQRLQADGFWLMDAVEFPINQLDGRVCPEPERQRIIRENIPSLLSRLNALRESGVLSPEAGVIILKKVVFSSLSEALRRAGFNVLHATKIDFPKYYGDRDTIAGVRNALAHKQTKPLTAI